MHIYFSGLGGVGVGPLAEIARDAGHTVSGSDLEDNLVTQRLREHGIDVQIGQDGSGIAKVHATRPIDWYVYTAALDKGKPERDFAQNAGIRVSKRDELLAEILKEKQLKLLAVAGTHGKTTTAAMLVWTMQQLGIPVSYSIGTTLSFGPSGIYTEASEYFIYECDEFDRNFLHFHPYLSIITSVDYDHPDTYPTIDDYTSAFRQFIHQSTSSILWQADADYMQTNEASAWCLQPDETLELALVGSHNRRNATLVLKTLERLGIGTNLDNRQAIESFPGSQRRFERLAENLYSDYGHHPAEIAATLQLARELSDHVVLVYQPHQNMRQHEIKMQYVDALFKDAEEVYWLPTYLSRENPALPVLTPEEVTGSIGNKKHLYYTDLSDELWQHITDARRSGKLVVCMGAGSIDSWVRTHTTTHA